MAYVGPAAEAKTEDSKQEPKIETASDFLKWLNDALYIARQHGLQPLYGGGAKIKNGEVTELSYGIGNKVFTIRPKTVKVEEFS